MAKWGAYSTDFPGTGTTLPSGWFGYGTRSISGNKLRFPITGSNFAGATRYGDDLLASHIFCRVEVPGNNTGQVSIDLYDSGTVRAQIRWTPGTLAFRVNGATLASVTYSPTTHAWWRIREASGTIYFDTSPDGTAASWTNRASTTTPAGMDTADCDLTAGGGTATSEAAFSSFNIEPAGGGEPEVIPQSLTGTLAPSGSLSRTSLVLRSGLISPASSRALEISRKLTGALIPSGWLSRQTNRALGGAVTASGALARGATYLRGLAGVLEPSGALQTAATRIVERVMSGTIGLAGIVERVADHRRGLAGGISPAGTLRRDLGRTLRGALAASGSLLAEPAAVIFQTLTGLLAPTGTVFKSAHKVLRAELIVNTLLIRAISKTVRSQLTLQGRRLRAIPQVLSGLISLLGNLTLNNYKRLERYRLEAADRPALRMSDTQDQSRLTWSSSESVE